MTLMALLKILVFPSRRGFSSQKKKKKGADTRNLSFFPQDPRVLGGQSQD